MNWVQRRIKREDAIRSGVGVLWQQLASTVADVVKSYNERYGKEHGNITAEPNCGSLWLKRKAMTADSNRLRSMLEDVALLIALEGNQSSVSAQRNGRSIIVVPIDANIDNDDLCFSQDGKPISLDEASQLLIEDFLFNPSLSAKLQR